MSDEYSKQQKLRDLLYMPLEDLIGIKTRKLDENQDIFNEIEKKLNDKTNKKFDKQSN